MLADIADLWAVGGAVRDAVLGVAPAEIDLAAPGPAWEEAARRLEGEMGPGHEVQKRHRTLRFSAAGRVVDLSLAEGGLDADLARRDYTANAIAWRPDSGHHDPLGGLGDLEAGVLRPASSTALGDDPLRVVRGARLAATLPLSPDAACLEAMRRAAPGLAAVAGERVREEFARGFGAAPAAFSRLLEDSGALDALFDFWPATRETPAGQPNDLSVSEHSHRVVSGFAEALGDPGRVCPEQAEGLEGWRASLGSVPWWWLLGALLHDCGKPPTLQVVEGRRRYTGHPQAGADLAAPALAGLRLAGLETEETLVLVAGHLRVSQVADAEGVPGRRAMYRYFRDLGRLAVPLVIHDWADAHGYPDDVRDDILDGRHRRIHEGLLAAAFEEPESVDPPSLVDGNDLIGIGYEPGPRLGEALEEIRLAQVDGSVDTREAALELAASLLEARP